jgi:hypothetical protein
MSNSCLGGDDEQEKIIKDDINKITILYIYDPFLLNAEIAETAE